jgi:SAM-dependent methyltransferase
LDYSLTQLKQAQQRLGRGERYTYVAADAYRLPFIPGLFDAATMIRVLHHMADAPQVLKEIRSVLQPGAAFILEFANKQNIKAILRYVLHRQNWNPFSPEPVEFVALNFDFHPQTVRRWLQENGFDVQRQLSVSHFRMGLLKRLVPLSLLVWMDSLAQRTGNWWQFSPSVFVQSLAVGNIGENTGGAQVTEQGAIFLCPECRHFPLAETPDALICSSCGRQWPFQDGIYDFRTI